MQGYTKLTYKLNTSVFRCVLKRSDRIVVLKACLQRKILLTSYTLSFLSQRVSLSSIFLASLFFHCLLNVKSYCFSFSSYVYRICNNGDLFRTTFSSSANAHYFHDTFIKRNMSNHGGSRIVIVHNIDTMEKNRPLYWILLQRMPNSKLYRLIYECCLFISESLSKHFPFLDVDEITSFQNYAFNDYDI